MHGRTGIGANYLPLQGGGEVPASYFVEPIQASGVRAPTLRRVQGKRVKLRHSQ